MQTRGPADGRSTVRRSERGDEMSFCVTRSTRSFGRVVRYSIAATLQVTRSSMLTTGASEASKDEGAVVAGREPVLAGTCEG
jgi:hypothetical protein